MAAPGAPAGGRGDDTAALYAGVVGAMQPPSAPRARWVSGGHRDDAQAAAAAPGIGPAARPAPAGSARERARAAAGAPASIARSNVGFQLLEKAGWREGTGLGSKAQGPLEPVGAFVKADRRGIGAETVGSVEVVGAPKEGRPAAAQQARPQQRPGADEAGAGDGGAAGGAAAPTARELSREQLAAHVRKRARDAAIGRQMRREFADTGEGASVPDSNPLTRRARSAAGGDRLRDCNPLRGMFADDA